MRLGNALSLIVGLFLFSFMLFILVKFPLVILLIAGLVLWGLVVENSHRRV